MVLVTFRSGDGKKYKIELPPETTIEDAKKAFLEKISSSLGNKQVSSIKMLFRRNQLDDKCTISSLNMENKDFIAVIIKIASEPIKITFQTFDDQKKYQMNLSPDTSIKETKAKFLDLIKPEINDIQISSISMFFKSKILDDNLMISSLKFSENDIIVVNVQKNEEKKSDDSEKVNVTFQTGDRKQVKIEFTKYTTVLEAKEKLIEVLTPEYGEIKLQSLRMILKKIILKDDVVLGSLHLTENDIINLYFPKQKVEKIHVTFQNLSNSKIYELDLLPNSKIGEAKERIAYYVSLQASEIEASSVKMIFRAQELEDDRTISSLNLRTNELINVYIQRKVSEVKEAVITFQTLDDSKQYKIQLPLYMTIQKAKEKFIETIKNDRQGEIQPSSIKMILKSEILDDKSMLWRLNLTEKDIIIVEIQKEEEEKETAENDNICVTFLTVDKKVLKVELTKFSTIIEAKEKLKKILKPDYGDIPINSMKASFKTKILNDKVIVSSLHLTENDVINLYVPKKKVEKTVVTFHIFQKNLDTKPYKIELLPNTTIGETKGILAEAIKQEIGEIQTSSIILIFKEEILSKYTTIESIKLKENDFIVAYIQKKDEIGDSQKVPVTFQTVDRKLHIIELNPKSSIAEAKKNFADLIKQDVGEIQLKSINMIFKGQILDDKCLISDLNLAETDFIVVHMPNNSKE